MGIWAESVGWCAIRSEMLDVRNYLATFVQAFNFYCLTIEARGKMSVLKSLRKAIKKLFLASCPIRG